MDKELDDKNMTIRMFSNALTALDPDRLTKQEIETFIKKILEFVTEMKKKNEETVGELATALNYATNQLAQKHDVSAQDIRNSVLSAMEDSMNKMYAEHEAMMAECKAVIDDVRDGEDADEDEIVEKVIAQIPRPEHKPETTESILEKLGLTKEELEELKKKKSYAPVGGPYSAVMPYVPTIQAVTSGDIDDANVTFGFDQKPSIVCVNGANYRENHGWVWSGGAVVLDAPVGTTGDIYSIL